MKLLVISLAGLILGVQSGLNPPVVDGDPTTIEERPYIVSLGNGEMHFCGGSLVSEQTVLTAAHCVNKGVPKVFLVNAGSTSRDKIGVMSTVEKVLIHPQNQPETTDFDYALLYLSKPLTFSSKIQKIELPSPDESPLPVGSPVNVSGWGDTLNINESSIELRTVQVSIIDHEKCNEDYKGRLTDQMICAGVEEGGKDSCQGDSGGPLVRNNKLYGVVSWGHGCALPGYPGVYANVLSVVPWIKKNLL